MSYRILSWDDDEARLKGFSSSSKAGALMRVKIEIEVRSPYCLADLLRRLEEIYGEQNAAARKAPAAKPKPSASRRTIGKAPAPLLLTFRED